jgi:hypothetical protein
LTTSTFDELIDAAGTIGPPLSRVECRTLWHVSSFTVLGSVEMCPGPTPKRFLPEKAGIETVATARDVGGDY